MFRVLFPVWFGSQTFSAELFSLDTRSPRDNDGTLLVPSASLYLETMSTLRVSRPRLKRLSAPLSVLFEPQIVKA